MECKRIIVSLIFVGRNTRHVRCLGKLKHGLWMWLIWEVKTWTVDVVDLYVSQISSPRHC
jgi:hypothetical protein